MKLLLKLGELLDASNFPTGVKDAVHEYVKSEDIDPAEVDVKRSGTAHDMIVHKEASRAIRHRPSTRHMDRDNEIIVPGGWILSEFKKAGGPHPWGHNYSQPLIGRDIEIAKDEMGLVAETVYGDTGEGTMADVAYKLRAQGIHRTASVGFARLGYLHRGEDEAKFKKFIDRLRQEWREMSDKVMDTVQVVTTKALLIEDSDVAIPSNVNAQTLQVLKGCKAGPDILKELGFEKFSRDLELIIKGEPDPDPEPPTVDVPTCEDCKAALEYGVAHKCADKTEPGPTVKVLGHDPVVKVYSPDVGEKEAVEKIFQKTLAYYQGFV